MLSLTWMSSYVLDFKLKKTWRSYQHQVIPCGNLQDEENMHRGMPPQWSSGRRTNWERRNNTPTLPSLITSTIDSLKSVRGSTEYFTAQDALRDSALGGSPRSQGCANCLRVFLVKPLRMMTRFVLCSRCCSVKVNGIVCGSINCGVLGYGVMHSQRLQWHLMNSVI